MGRGEEEPTPDATMLMGDEVLQEEEIKPKLKLVFIELCDYTSKNIQTQDFVFFSAHQLHIILLMSGVLVSFGIPNEQSAPRILTMYFSVYSKGCISGVSRLKICHCALSPPWDPTCTTQDSVFNPKPVHKKSNIGLRNNKTKVVF